MAAIFAQCRAAKLRRIHGGFTITSGGGLMRPTCPTGLVCLARVRELGLGRQPYQDQKRPESVGAFRQRQQPLAPQHLQIVQLPGGTPQHIQHITAPPIRASSPAVRAVIRRDTRRAICPAEKTPFHQPTSKADLFLGAAT